MTYTAHQIASAARLVPDQVYTTPEGEVRVRRETGTSRLWQPRSPNEAGRSDALVLLAAVMKWLSDNAARNADPIAYNEWNEHQLQISYALDSGDLEQIQQATFAAAVVIGEYMGATNDR